MAEAALPAVAAARTAVIAVKPKNIVICADGTGNTANKDRGTNVFKLYEALDLTGHLLDPQASKQIAFYHDGVGTESLKALRLLGGAFGWGLSRNVRQLYAELVRSYNPPHDRIFMFGFSRGAFTVRTLAAFVAYCGILDRTRYRSDSELCGAVSKAYRVYRTRYMGVPERLLQTARVPKKEMRPNWTLEDHAFHAEYKPFKEKHQPHEAKVAFVGVWDTVDAVGLPFDQLSYVLNAIYPYKFTGFGLHERVERARHALAIDEERDTFHPLLWRETGADRTSGRIKQVWFPGVHSNVGGGYPKQGMSLVALDWMMAEAADAGLRFLRSDREAYQNRSNVNDKLYDSRSGLGIYYRYKPRDIAALCAKFDAEPRIHESAVERVRHQTDGYAPGNLPASLRLVPTLPTAATRYPAAARRFKDAQRGVRSQLDALRRTILFRRLSHYGFFGLSLALAGVLVWPQLHADQGLLAVTKAIFTLDTGANALVAGFAMNPEIASVLLVLTALFFGAQSYAAGSLKRHFSAFWLRLLGERRPEPPEDVIDVEEIEDRPA